MAQVLPPASPHDSPPYFSSTPPLNCPSTPRQSLIVDAGALSKSLERSRAELECDQPNPTAGTSEPSSLSSSPRQYRSSSDSTPASSISLDKVDDADELSFPTFENAKFDDRPEQMHPTGPATETGGDQSPSVSESTPTNESNLTSPGVGQVHDDSAVHEEPSIQVDYLSHEWREEDIWRSWKHIVSNRKTYGERSRLENASWRTWAKAKYSLRTVSPERLNWLKDCDVTWLYGPLQEAPWRRRGSEPSSKLSKSNSFISKKPILKKRSVSEMMLQTSISNSSLVKQAAAAVQAQRESMQNGSQQKLSRTPSDFLGCIKTPCAGDGGALQSTLPSYSSSGLQSPDGCRRHIRFDDKVEQCIAVEFQTSELSEDYPSSIPNNTDESASSSEDEPVMMKTKSSKPTSTSSSRRSSIGQDSVGIAMLPATTLNDHDDGSVEQAEHSSLSRGSHHMGRLQPSPSQETLKPKNPASNFLISDDDDEAISWTPSDAWGSSGRDGSHGRQDSDSAEQYNVGLRRTPSGMFMPFDEDEEEQTFASAGVLGRVVDTVNTARDIMHVIMNVGWRS